MSETIRYRPWAEPGAAAVTFLPKMTEHAGARRRELDHAEVVTRGEIGVEPPPEPSVELLRAVDIRDGDDDQLELHVDFRGARVFGVVTADFLHQICHVFPPICSSKFLNYQRPAWAPPST